MPIMDTSKIVSADYAKLDEVRRFNLRIRQQAFEMVECSGMAVQEVAAVLRKIASDVDASIL